MNGYKVSQIGGCRVTHAYPAFRNRYIYVCLSIIGYRFILNIIVYHDICRQMIRLLNFAIGVKLSLSNRYIFKNVTHFNLYIPLYVRTVMFVFQ